MNRNRRMVQTVTWVVVIAMVLAIVASALTLFR
jgi:hypothetical protein